MQIVGDVSQNIVHGPLATELLKVLRKNTYSKSYPKPIRTESESGIEHQSIGDFHVY